MGRTYCQMRLLIVVTLLAAPGGVVAQMDGSGTKAQQRPQVDSQRTGGESGAAHASIADEGKPSVQSEASARRQAARVSKLHVAAMKRLNLSKAQASAIDALFRDYIASLRGIRGGGRPFGASPADAGEMAALRERLQSARKAGDERTMRQLRKEFREMMNSRKNAVALTLDEFLAKVMAQLSGEQRPEFQRLVRATGVRGNRGRSANGELRKFWRAVTSPAVAMTEEQRRVSTAIMRDGVSEFSKAHKEGGETAVIATRIRAEVMDQLTSSQRIKVEVALGLRPKPVAAPPPAEPEPVEPEEKVAAKRQPDLEPEPEVKPPPAPKPEQEPEPKAGTTAQPEGEQKPKETPKPEPKPEPAVEPKPKPAPEPKPEPAPKEEAPKPKPAESEPEPEPKPQPKPKAEPKPQPPADEKGGSGESDDKEESSDEEDDG